MKKSICVFVFQKYDKFWCILPGHFIKHKPLISEEWWLGKRCFLKCLLLFGVALKEKISLQFFRILERSEPGRKKKNLVAIYHTDVWCLLPLTISVQNFSNHLLSQGKFVANIYHRCVLVVFLWHGYLLVFI